MKKKIGIILAVLSLILTAFIFINREKISYEITVSDFEEIRVEDLKELSESEDTVFLYIGRKTCPYCRAFIPKLKSVADTNDLEIYYIDSEDKENDTLNTFRKKYQLNTVPALVKINGDTIISIMDSTLNKEGRNN